MYDLKDFKKTADEAMSEIRVSDVMKDNVINKIRRKNRMPAGRLMALAACAAFILVALDLTGALKMQNQQENRQDQQMNIFSATNAAPDAASNAGPSDSGIAEESGNSAVNKAGEANEWDTATLEEAGTAFGPEFLMPAYIPEGFKIGRISAYGPDTKNADKIIIYYNSGDRSFTITEQKESSDKYNPDIFKGFRKVRIGGSEGYLKSVEPDGGGTSDTGSTEMHWFIDSAHYSIAGDMPQADALITAEMMLPLGQ